MTDSPLLSIQDLSIDFKTNDGVFHAVKNISFDLKKGETLSLIGESGSGKSVSALSILKLLPASASYPTGKILYKGDNILTASEKKLRSIRGREVSMIFQEPMTSLNPLHTIEKQISEPLMLHQGMRHEQAKARVLELLDLVQMSRLKDRLNAYPHELSGGQRQRVMIAMALANNPQLLIADEPTTALDVTVQAEILKLLQNLQKELSMAMLFISHDLNLVKHISNHVCVMQDGKIKEQSDTKTIFEKPEHNYTKKLLSAVPSGTAIVAKQNDPIIQAYHLNVRFPLEKNWLGRTKKWLNAVDDISFSLEKGKTLGVVGESGSGKTTLGMSLLKLVESQGDIRFSGSMVSRLEKKDFFPYRKRIQVVFQDPFGSLSPRLSIAEIISEGLCVHQKNLTKADIETQVINTLKSVELDPETRHRYPHEFSGGQRQRIAIARALIMDPELIILDEPTSALDMSVQVSIVSLLKRLQTEKKLSYIFISHDLRVVRSISHDILVMKDGKVIEHGNADDVFNHPKEAYTKRLFDAVLFKDIAA